ncbi:FecR family protein [Larkinella insperata]|uniref:FecR family protein n=1 Tax=Larkinella insperata TaxID=332158 RepID=A0ABW3QNS4_9BACT|nr:FecR family protein [Larkinella insperata]
MNQYDFDKLIEKYLAGQCSPEEEEWMREWSERQLGQTSLSFSEDEKKVVGKQIWKRVHGHTLGRRPFVVRYGWLGLSAAAAVLLTLAGLWFGQPLALMKRTVADQHTVSPGTVEVNNTSGKPQKITLKDGSWVVLQPNSRISYPEQFGEKTRQLTLRGEAFFDVKKDPARPFIVKTGELVTQVLGTSFTIKSYDEAKAIEVAVLRGRVSVYETAGKSPGSRNGVILVPNHKITFDKTSQTLTPSLVEAPRIVHPPETRTSFVFTNKTISEVFSALGDAYGIDFIVENQTVNNCVFNGDLNDLPLYTQLDLICKSVNATYERRGTTLFIHGEGCADF